VVALRAAPSSADRKDSEISYCFDGRLLRPTCAPDAAGHGADDSDELFRPFATTRPAGSTNAITPDGMYKLVRAYSAQLGFEIGAHALRATAATNALDHQADIAKVQEWLGHANIATTRIYDHRRDAARGQSDLQGQLLNRARPRGRFDKPK
jgi:integrase